MRIAIHFCALPLPSTCLLILVSKMWECPCMQPVLAGFNGVDPFSLCNPDSLHQTDLGDAKRIADAVYERFSDRQAAGISNYLSTIPPYMGLQLPTGGLGTGMVYASQHAGLLKCLPVALLGSTHESAPAFIEAATGTPGSKCLTKYRRLMILLLSSKQLIPVPQLNPADDNLVRL